MTLKHEYPDDYPALEPLGDADFLALMARSDKVKDITEGRMMVIPGTPTRDGADRLIRFLQRPSEPQWVVGIGNVENLAVDKTDYPVVERVERPLYLTEDTEVPQLDHPGYAWEPSIFGQAKSRIFRNAILVDTRRSRNRVEGHYNFKVNGRHTRKKSHIKPDVVVLSLDSKAFEAIKRKKEHHDNLRNESAVQESKRRL